MKFVLLGATGATGQCLLKQAVADGHNVKAVVRTPEKLDPVIKELKDDEKDKLEVVKGDVFKADSLEEIFKGTDMVISTLGFSIKNRNLTGYSDVTKATVEAMAKAECKRLILMHSYYTKPDSRSGCPFLLRTLFLPLIRPALDDMDRAEQFLRSIKEGEPGHDIDWTCVCPPGLTNGPVTDKELHTTEGAYMVTKQAVTLSGRISRADVARFLLRVAKDGSYKKDVVAVTV